MYEEIYSHDTSQMWSGNPNQALVREITPEIPRGRALDIGAGEGADALWLSQQGFAVTALEPSDIAVARIEQLAAENDVVIEIVEDTFEQASLGQYELVTAFYTPLLSDAASVEKLLKAVAPSGWLLVVHHAVVEPMAHRLDKKVEDFLLPPILKQILDSREPKDFRVASFGTFERHVTHGGGAGHSQDELILVQRML